MAWCVSSVPERGRGGVAGGALSSGRGHGRCFRLFLVVGVCWCRASANANDSGSVVNQSIGSSQINPPFFFFLSVCVLIFLPGSFLLLAGPCFALLWFAE